MSEVLQGEVLPTQAGTGLTNTRSIEALIGAQGNINLAAERLKTTPSALLLSLAQDPTSAPLLAEHLKLFSLLNLFKSLSASQQAFEVSIPNLEPYEAVKSFTTLLQLVQSFTATGAGPSTQNINITEIVMKMLPQNAREALNALVQGQ